MKNNLDKRAGWLRQGCQHWDIVVNGLAFPTAAILVVGLYFPSLTGQPALAAVLPIPSCRLTTDVFSEDINEEKDTCSQEASKKPK